MVKTLTNMPPLTAQIFMQALCVLRLQVSMSVMLYLKHLALLLWVLPPAFTSLLCPPAFPYRSNDHTFV